MYDLGEINDFIQSYRNDGFDKSNWELARHRDWRLFTQKFEDRLLDVNIAVLKEKIENIRTFEGLWELINQVNKYQNIEMLSDKLFGKVDREIKRSKLDNIESMVVKRVKQLYFQNKSIENINGFVAMMEEVLV